MTTPSKDHRAREAEIRQRIKGNTVKLMKTALEMSKQIANVKVSDPNGLHRLLMDKSHPGESHVGVATYNDVSAEDCDAVEAAIRSNERQRIAREVRNEIDLYTATHLTSETMREHVAGMVHALHIIYPGGAQPEGERG